MAVLVRLPVRRRALGLILLLGIFLTPLGCRTNPLPAGPVPSITASPQSSSVSPSPIPTSSPPPEIPAYHLQGFLGRGAAASLAWSPDGLSLAVATTAGAYLFDAQTLTETAHLTPTAALTALAWSPDGLSLAGGGQDGDILLWQAADGTLRNRLHTGGAAVTALAWSPDGAQLAIGRADGTLSLWTATSGQLSDALLGHSDRLTALAFCGHLPESDTPALYTAGRDGTVTLWNPRTARLVIGLRLPGSPVTALACRPGDGRLYLSDQGGNLEAWGPHGLVLRYAAFAQPLLALSVPAQSPWLAGGDTVGRLALWSNDEGQPLRHIQAHSGAVLTLAYAPDGETLASLGSDGWLRLWNGAPQVNRDTETPPVRGELGPFPGRGQTGGWLAGRLVSAHANGTLLVWPGGNSPTPLVLSGHRGAVTALVGSPDGQTLISGGMDGTLRTWRLSDGQLVGTRYLHRNRITALALSGDMLVSADGSGALVVWKGENPRAQTTLPEGVWGRALVVQASNTLWVLGSDGMARPYALPDLTPLTLDSPWPAALQAITCAADTNLCAALDEQGNAWYGSTGHMQPLSLPEAVATLWLTPDGQTLLLGSASGQVWQAAQGQVTPLFHSAAPPVWLSADDTLQHLYLGLHNGQIAVWEKAGGG